MAFGLLLRFGVPEHTFIEEELVTPTSTMEQLSGGIVGSDTTIPSVEFVKRVASNVRRRCSSSVDGFSFDICKVYPDMRNT
eukprot:scaffold17514_cov74-Skeletonema_menzelii.AAC.1